MNNRMYCLNCGEEREIDIREETESYPVKNEQTVIDAKITYCKYCGEQIWNEELDDENLKEAYKKYRSIHGLLQPEQIKKIREKYSLTQTAFAKILGLGEKTITRYENGCIQDAAQNNLIELAGFPDVFDYLLKKNAKQISENDFHNAEEALKKYKPVIIMGGKPYSYRTNTGGYCYKNEEKYFGGIMNGR
jgi:putative zinc finger/helix-turn-helix YgiT family protein